MRFYLSSYKLGNNTEKLKKLVPSGKIGYIPSAWDFSGVDPEKRKEHIEEDMDSLRALGLKVELLELHDYFKKRDKLEKKLNELGAIFISGGNVFVLRQAMRLSGFDEIFKKLCDRKDFLYSGYSAAICVLAPELKAYEIVDKIDTPYNEQKDIIWDGLGFLDFSFMPHWRSNHPESASIEKEVAYCEQNNIPYRTIKDGEVVIIE